LLTQRVRVAKARTLTHTDENGHANEAWGMFDSDQLCIHIRTGQAPDRERETFMHENLHLIVNACKMGDVDSEEELVSRLSPIVLSWMRENPRAVAYLLEKT
jgi:Zn-dependent peptidase ImmA (M78 family)